jgi:hypothetical protein
MSDDQEPNSAAPPRAHSGDIHIKSDIIPNIWHYITFSLIFLLFTILKAESPSVCLSVGRTDTFSGFKIHYKMQSFASPSCPTNLYQGRCN